MKRTLKQARKLALKTMHEAEERRLECTEREEIPEDGGFTVKIELKPESPYGGVKQTLENITEIHYGYDGCGSDTRIEFESDIEQTINIYDLADIKEFEAVCDAI